MDASWFFDTLGLSPCTDEREIKRAYARRLREIDPAAEPAAFARLREAYEAARAWVAEAAAPSDVIAQGSPPDSGPIVAPATETAVDKARRLLDTFCRQMRDDESLHVEHALNAVFADLRLMQIEAATAFQAFLVDRLIDGTMPRRDVVFRAALAYFAWNDVNHAVRLGPQRHAWVDAVERQRHALLRSPAGLRTLALLEEAGRSGALRPPEPLQRAMADAAMRYPQLVGLHVSEGVRETWARRHGEKPSFSLRRVWKENWPLIVAWAFLLSVCGSSYIVQLVRWVGHHHATTVSTDGSNHG